MATRTRPKTVAPRKSNGKKGNLKVESMAPFREDPAAQFQTTNTGLLINDNQNSLKAGDRGPSLLEDFHLREKITHFDHERIPERVVHARGSAAHGVFQVYEPMARLTRARFLNDPARQTPVFVRFSTVAGSRGSTDLARDVRGFAVRFYTDEGNFDLVGNNIPVFFIQDAIKFPDLIHSVKPEPHHEMPQAASAHDTFWDFVSLMPESMHMIMWAMSDRAIPRSFRMMEGFGIHTFRFVNERGQSNFVKFHWKPLLGVHSVLWDEATKISGKDPDFHRRDLWEAIETGAFPEWEFGVQIVPEEDEHKFGFDLLDPTKIIPEEVVPVTRIGKLTLNRNPDNFFAETEQVAFHPGNVVPGIDFSDDPLLQGRLFSYLDTQLLRLGGANFNEIPINRPLHTVHNGERDGHMRQQINVGRVSYEPNSLAGGCPYQSMVADGGFASFPAPVPGPKVRARGASFFDHFSQATMFYQSQSPVEQNHIVNALRFELGKVETPHVRERVVGLLAHVDGTLASRVAKGLGMTVPTKLPGGPLNQSIPADGKPEAFQPKKGKPPVPKSPALSMANTIKDSIKTRRVAVLAADGVDVTSVTPVIKALVAAGAVVKVVAPRLGEIKGKDGAALHVDFSLLTTSSVLFDAVFIPDGERGVSALKVDPRAIHFVTEAYEHCKAILAVGGGVDLYMEGRPRLAPGGPTMNGKKVVTEEGIVLAKSGGAGAAARAFMDAIAAHRHWSREPNFEP
jgi:catalase